MRSVADGCCEAVGETGAARSRWRRRAHDADHFPGGHRATAVTRTAELSGWAGREVEPIGCVPSSIRHVALEEHSGAAAAVLTPSAKVGGAPDIRECRVVGREQLARER